MTTKRRDIAIDILRGFAIFTMVAANLAGEALAEPHPFWLRLYGSFAAPIFIILAGLMVAMNTQHKGYNLNFFINRGVKVIVVAALIDVLLWKYYPFISCDVLYLIGLSIPLVYLFSKLNKYIQVAFIMIIFLVTPLLQQVLSYTDYPTEIYISFLTDETADPVANQTNVLNHFLIDGWFPLFPWIGFSFLGSFFILLRKKYSIFTVKPIVLSAIGISLIGGVLWSQFPGPLLTRGGYSELFYPPTIGYIFFSIGVFMLLLSLIDLKPNLFLYKPFQVLGESSLFMYILHLVLIAYIVSAYWSKTNLSVFLTIYGIMILLMIGIGYFLRFIKSKNLNLPKFIKFLIGG